MLTIEEFQTQQLAWTQHNFGEAPEYHPLLGIVEEMGELAHSKLKSLQGIRGSMAIHDAEGKDAIGDCTIFLTDYCTKKSWQLNEILNVTTFDDLQKRCTIEPIGVQIGSSVPPCVKLLLEAAHAAGKASIAECSSSRDSGRVALATFMGKLASYCAIRGWSLQEIVETTWAEVSKRDWTVNAQTGEASE